MKLYFFISSRPAQALEALDILIGLNGYAELGSSIDCLCTELLLNSQELHMQKHNMFKNHVQVEEIWRNNGQQNSTKSYEGKRNWC